MTYKSRAQICMEAMRDCATPEEEVAMLPRLFEAIEQDTAAMRWHGPLLVVMRPTGEPVRNSCSLFDRESEAIKEKHLCEKYNPGRYEVRPCYIVEIEKSSRVVMS